MMLAMEKRREEFDQRMDKEHKDFELKLDERIREERKRTKKTMIWLTIAGTIFAVTQVYAAWASINPEHGSGSI